MTQLTFYSTEIDVFLRLALLGIGTAIFQSPTNRAIMSKIPNGQAGVASGILVTMRNLGMVFAVCYAGILLSTTINPTTLQLNSLIPLQAYESDHRHASGCYFRGYFKLNNGFFISNRNFDG